MALYIILAIAIIISAIIFIPIDTAFFVSYYEKNGSVRLGIKYSFINVRLLPKDAEKPKKKKRKKLKKEKAPKKERKKQPLSVTMEFAKEVFKECMPKVTRLIKHLFTHTLQTKRFYIKGKFGTGNPMYTGIAYGSASAAIYNLVAFIDRNSKLYEWKVDIKPDFNAACAEGEAELIIRTRVAYIIRLICMAAVIGIKIILINRRIKKNG